MKNLLVPMLLSIAMVSHAHLPKYATDRMEKKVPSKIQSVTVYQTRAEIIRSASSPLTMGRHELVFNGISTSIDPNNIQVRGTGNLIILGISFRQNYLDENKLPTDLQRVKNEMKTLQMGINRKNNSMDGLESERKLLEFNQKIGGNQVSISMEELSRMASFYRTRLTNIANEKLEIRGQIDEIKQELIRLRAHYDDRASQFRKNLGEIVVNVEVKRTTTANITLTYMVSNARWRAEYDLRSEAIGSPLQLSYKAIITQNTGENWKEVKLTLSTGNPAMNTKKPTMNPQYLDFDFPAQNLSQTKVKMMSLDRRSEARGTVSGRIDSPHATEAMEEEDLFSELGVGIGKKTLYTNYEIKQPYSLNSGNKPLTVTVRNQEVEADYEYQAVPKLRNRVFLIAKAKNWESLVLLPGSMNIFFEGGYVGKSYMNPQTTADELPLSLGYDPEITINRKLLVDISSKKVIGTNQKETYTYEISIRNNKQVEVMVKIQDQIPVTKNTDIKVEVVDIEGASHNQITGEITWKINLKSTKEVKKRFGYEVKYPKNKTIRGL